MLLLAAGCAGPQQPVPPPAKKIAARAPAATLPAPRADIRGELLGWVVVGSFDSLLSTASTYVAPGVPAPVQPFAQPEALKTLLFTKFHLENIAPALDGSRSFAVGFADPMVYRQGELGATILAVPVKDAAEFVDGLERMATRRETTPWKDRIFDFNGNRLLCRVEKDWAFVASHEKLLHGAREALLPLAAKGAPGRLQLTIDMNAVQARYSAQLDRAADVLAALVAKPQMAAMKVTLRRWLAYLRGMRALDFRLDLQGGKMQLLVAAHSLGQGEFRKFLDNLAVGEPWGAKYVPADAAVLLLDRTRTETWLQMVDDSLQTFQSTVGKNLSPALVSKLREAMAASMRQFGEQSAWGLWVSSDGGIGAGGVMAVKDAAAAQKQFSKAAKLAGSVLFSPLLQKQLPEPQLRVSFGVRPAALTIAGLKADLYEVTLGGPRPKDKDARRKQEETKKAIAKVLGPKPTFAFVATGDLGLMTFGKDYKKRLADLVAIAKGGAGSTEEKLCRELAGGRRLAMLVHSSLVNVIDGVMRVADRLSTVPSELRDAVNKALPSAGKNIPVTMMMHKDRDTLFWELEISPDLVASVARAFFHFQGLLRGP